MRFSKGREYFPTRVNMSYISTGLESIRSDPVSNCGGRARSTRSGREAYLQLPDTLPDRVRVLAETLAVE